MEKYEHIFNSLSSDTSEDIKLKLLVDLLVIYSNYFRAKQHPIIHRFREPSRNGLIYEYPTFAVENPSFSSRSNKSSKASRFLAFFSKKKIYREEEYDIIKATFYKIIGNYQSYDQNESKRLLFLPNYIQFLLDSFIVTHHFLTLFLLPLNKEKWVDIDKFILSLESIQQMSFDRASFFYNERDSQFKKIVTIQKMLFFYKFAEFYVGRCLDEENLSFVIKLSLRNKKKSPDSVALAKSIFSKIERSSLVPNRNLISFQEFFNVIVNIN